MPRKTSSATMRTKPASRKPDLVVITGLSGSGKGSVLRALEDLGFYSVDNLPVELIPKFAELTHDNPSIHRPPWWWTFARGRDSAVSQSVRRHSQVGKRQADFPGGRQRGHRPPVQRNPPPSPSRHQQVDHQEHPLGASPACAIRAMADLTINTSKFTVHELRSSSGSGSGASGTSPKS